MEKRVKVVMLPYGKGKKIAQALGISEKTVTQAIKGYVDNDLARKIRYVAIKEYGGEPVIYYEDHCADCDTIHTDTGMEAIYTDRVKIIYDENTNVAGVYIDGELKSTRNVKSIGDYMEFQQQVQKIVDTLK